MFPPHRALPLERVSHRSLTCDDHVEELGVPEQLHGGVVNVHVRQLDVGVVLADADDDLLPQLADLEHVALVH